MSKAKTNTQNFHLKTKKDIFFDTLFYLIITVVCFACLLPFIHVLSKSISSEHSVIANEIILLPKGINFEAYKKILQDKSIVNSMFVTIFITITFTIIGMFLTICGAYALSQKNLKGRKVLTAILMFTMYFSAGMIPEYMLISKLALLDTVWSLILPLAFSAYNFLLMKNYFQHSIPDSLIESAFLDGANHFKILIKIILPLSKPILATIALFLAVGRWNAYSDALFYIKQNVDIRPLQLKLYYLVVASSESFQLEGGGGQVMTNPEVLKSATVMFATLPIICIYPFVQKYFVDGVMIGAVKG